MELNFYQRRISAEFIFILIAVFLLNYSQIYSQKVRIMPLGDSITNGESPQPDSLFTGYRQPLWLLLQLNNYPVDFVGNDSAGYAAQPEYDFNNAGYGGYSIKQISHLIKTGLDRDENVITPGPYLNYYPADVILLHIGTNDVDTTIADLEDLLNYFDNYQDTTNSIIWVILAKIINEVPYSLTTTIYNNNIEKMAEDRIKKGDHLKIVDMENDAGLIYQIDTVAPYNNGDMYDHLHPNNRGYAKMASLFYDSLNILLSKIVPVELTSFASSAVGDSVKLYWQTALELNNYGFAIERSDANNIWENVGFVQGADNSHNINDYQFTDIPYQTSSHTYIYRLRQIENNGNSKYIAQLDVKVNSTTSVQNKNSNLPKVFALEQNYPNPFNPATIIKYSLPVESRVNLKIYNSLGQEVVTLVDDLEGPGIYEKVWNAGNYASGVYFYILNVSALSGQHPLRFSNKMILLK
jgi:lysophospholipase L1-like esterase